MGLLSGIKKEKNHFLAFSYNFFIINFALKFKGASSGIGKATAEYFAEKGYSLSLNGRNEKALEATVNSCITKGLSKDSVLLDDIFNVFDKGIISSCLIRYQTQKGS